MGRNAFLPQNLLVPHTDLYAPWKPATLKSHYHVQSEYPVSETSFVSPAGYSALSSFIQCLANVCLYGVHFFTITSAFSKNSLCLGFKNFAKIRTPHISVATRFRGLTVNSMFKDKQWAKNTTNPSSILDKGTWLFFILNLKKYWSQLWLKPICQCISYFDINELHVPMYGTGVPYVDSVSARLLEILPSTTWHGEEARHLPPIVVPNILAAGRAINTNTDQDLTRLHRGQQSLGCLGQTLTTAVPVRWINTQIRTRAITWEHDSNKSHQCTCPEKWRDGEKCRRQESLVMVGNIVQSKHFFLL